MYYMYVFKPVFLPENFYLSVETFAEYIFINLTEFKDRLEDRKI